MSRKIIIKQGRELTEDEINRLEIVKVIFSTYSDVEGGRIDRFAGVNMPQKTAGIYDNISCIMSKVRKIEGKENEYEITFEETNQVRGLDRVKVGGPGAGYNMKPLEEQLNHLQKTELAELMKNTDIIEQIKQKYEEEKNNSSYYATYRFGDSEQRKMIQNEIFDILSMLHLREKAQVEEINNDESKKILNIIKDDKGEGYRLMEFPCKIIFSFHENKLRFSGTVSPEENTLEETRESIIDRILKINTLLDLNYMSKRYLYSFTMPEIINSEEDFHKLITDMEQMQLENINVEKIPFSEIDTLLTESDSNGVFEVLIKKYDAETILNEITNTNDNELKKRLMEKFSQKNEIYTEEQEERIKRVLKELLEDENGWENNGNIIARFELMSKSTLSYDEKMNILQMSINSHNNYCSKIDDESIQQRHQIVMSLSALINILFTGEEQIELVKDLVEQKKYQEMIMILRECSREDERDKYNRLPDEQKDIMAEELIKYHDDAPTEWKHPRYEYAPYGSLYIKEYISEKKEKQKMDAFEQIAEKKTFNIVERGIFNETTKQQILCFEDYRDNIEAYIDIEEASNNMSKGKLHIDIPEKYMGMMIGKQGSNIKRIQEQIKSLCKSGDVKIILHPHKDAHVITLKEVKDFIEKYQVNELGEM